MTPDDHLDSLTSLVNLQIFHLDHFSTFLKPRIFSLQVQLCSLVAQQQNDLKILNCKTEIVQISLYDKHNMLQSSQIDFAKVNVVD